MEWVEITGRTVKEATDLALDELGVDDADAEIQVLEEPRAGLFGRTKGVARVKARVIPRQHRPKQERRNRKRPGGQNRGRGAASGANEGRDEAPTGGGSGGESSGAPSASGSGGGRRRRRSGGGQAAAKEGGAASAARPVANDGGDRPQEGVPVDAQIMSFDEHVATVERFVAGLVEAFGLEGSVEVVVLDEETREVRVTGDDLGLLIGPRGLTLQAVHELARTIVFRAAPDGQEGRVRVDIGGYRERRRIALEQFATSVAETVRESGQAKALEPMAAPDRKVVHDTINDVDGVRTTSEGEEPRRRVVIHPTD